MELNERKQKILHAIIQNYQKTGEPVGSRTISKMKDLNFSSATIRNEMADLEEMGLIVQPHTSAGRIPTDKGYRWYVDRMLEGEAEEKQLPEERTSQELLIRRVDRVEELLLQMAQILAANTRYTTMVTGPHTRENKLKFIQLSSMGSGKILAVIVLGGNIVKNNIIALTEDISPKDLQDLNFLLNDSLNGLSLADINLEVISRIKKAAGEHAAFVDQVLNAVAETFGRDDGYPVYTSGTTNIFRYPELTGGDKASELIGALEHKESLGTALTLAEGDSKQDIHVYIGDEVPVDSMKDCSVVIADYELGDGVQGKIGIIGPKRMDYKKVVDTLKNTMSQLDTIFKKTEE